MANAPEVFVIREFEVKSGPLRPTGCYKITCDRFQRGRSQAKKELIEELQKGNPRFLGTMELTPSCPTVHQIHTEHWKMSNWERKRIK